ncbi:MAG: hypothetical protein Q7Q71_13270 [Verrucomicrobiota bacterium JB023]|nr:hypothetical protein [Verrucomicrobiota bacterium JB023]
MENNEENEDDKKKFDFGYSSEFSEREEVFVDGVIGLHGYVVYPCLKKPLWLSRYLRPLGELENGPRKMKHEIYSPE